MKFKLLILLGSVLFLTSCAVCQQRYCRVVPCIPCDNYHECIDHVDKWGCDDGEGASCR